MRQRQAPVERPSVGQVAAVAREMAAEAGISPDLLGDYLTILSEAALEGRRPSSHQLAGLRRLGQQAASAGMDADRAVDLYLSAAWRWWAETPAATTAQSEDVHTAAEAVLRVVSESVQALVDGHQAARREMIRREESTRREFIDDLLRGDADISRLVQRAQPFGLDLGRRHRVLLAKSSIASLPVLEWVASPLERAVVERYGDREVLVATKDTFVVVIMPGDPSGHGAAVDHDSVTSFLRDHLRRHTGNYAWQVSAGRPYAGAYGVASSYEEAREALALAQRLRLDPVEVQPRELLLYRVIGRDQAALADLVQGLLDPLTQARGGAEPLLTTLETYFHTGGVATETARQLHVSVRTVTYRLAKIAALTGADPVIPAHALALHVAVVGARLLQWPER